MPKERTPYDYFARDVSVTDSEGRDSALYSDKPFPGEGSVYSAGTGNKAGAGRGKQGGPTAKEIEGVAKEGKAKEIEGKAKGGSVKGWGMARGARKAKYY